MKQIPIASKCKCLKANRKLFVVDHKLPLPTTGLRRPKPLVVFLFTWVRAARDEDYKQIVAGNQGWSRTRAAKMHSIRMIADVDKISVSCVGPKISRSKQVFVDMVWKVVGDQQNLHA
ncbi:hypothetical protein [Acidobacterium sp. S8]|uniref:hypothetical protein n=1 Tax=Acidobacterium sp. S8 TaxID=1641854 RepID=UPI00131E5772|nr:hypothetical protein [Acidobacterium sp. S8]